MWAHCRGSQSTQSGGLGDRLRGPAGQSCRVYDASQQASKLQAGGFAAGFVLKALTRQVYGICRCWMAH